MMATLTPLGLGEKLRGCARLVLERLAQSTAVTWQKLPQITERWNILALQITGPGMCRSDNLIELLATGGASCTSLQLHGMRLLMAKF